MSRPAAAPVMLVVELGLDLSNAEVREKMLAMKQALEQGVTNVLCCIGGFGDDPRELWEIPEVRGYCRRLVALGFPAFLDPCASAHPMTNGGFGAAEVIWVAEGKVPPAGVLDAATVGRTNAAIINARKIAAATVGPLVRRRR